LKRIKGVDKISQKKKVILERIGNSSVGHLNTELRPGFTNKNTELKKIKGGVLCQQ